MNFINVIDDQGRFVELKIDSKLSVGQENSHTFSYLHVMREWEKEFGDIGLAKKEECYELSTK